MKVPALVSSLRVAMMMMMMGMGSVSCLILASTVGTTNKKNHHRELKSNDYLASSDIIDYDHPTIQELAQKLRQRATVETEEADEATTSGSIIQNCFEYVRDNIKHSWDYQCNPVTCKASDVLLHQTGYCYAKSHLLAALLRANGIPTGLCYQRLSIDDHPEPPYEDCSYCLHGLNAVYLQNNNKNQNQNKRNQDQDQDRDEDGYWYRIDPRGIKPGIQHANFCPPKEVLAFPLQIQGEIDFPEIHVDPLPVVIEALQNSKTWKDVAENLPDMKCC